MLGSLALALGALAVALWLFRPSRLFAPPPPPPAAVPAAEAPQKTMRTAMRSSQRDAAAAGRDPSSAASLASSGPRDAAFDAEDPDVQRAIDMIDSGKPQDAVTVLDGVLKRDPRNEQALIEMAMVQLIDLKQPAEALPFLQRAIDVNPRNPVVLSELVSLYEDQNKVDDGISYLADLYTKNPSSPELAQGMGQLLATAGRDGEAVPYLERAAQSPDYQVRAYRDLADAYARSGDTEKSLDAYDKSIVAQEQEIGDKSQRGLPVAFAEERLAYTKLEKAGELVRSGALDAAQTLLDEVQGVLPGDEKIASLRETIRRKRAG
jgi:tetratricopeptide (TPR) repeat protein